MKTRTSTRTPKYRRQRRPNSADQAFVELNGHKYYLGRYDSEESKQKYHKLIAEWLAGNKQVPVRPDEITVKELILRYLKHAEIYYQTPESRPSREVNNIRASLRVLRRLYGDVRVAEFGPLSLEAVRNAFIKQGGSRQYVNKQVGHIKRAFRWGVSKELVPPKVLQALESLEGLKLGRGCGAPEGPGVKPAPEHLITAVENHVSRQVWALIRLQQLTAARPGELVIIRPVDLDMSLELRNEDGQAVSVWEYRPATHKTAYRGHERTIFIGPKAQEVLRPFLAGRPLDAYMFSPREAEEERRAKLHKHRETPLSCGNKPGSNRKRKPRRQPGEKYTVVTYRQAIIYGCDAAFPLPDYIENEENKQKQHELEQKWRKEHRWHPHQLRHNAATEINREFGLEEARLLLGHRKADVTQIYAEPNREKAIQAAAKVG